MFFLTFTKNNTLMKHSILFIFLSLFFFSFSQDQLEDYYFQRSFKEDGIQYQFHVLDDDKHGVWFYKKDKVYFWYKAQHILSTQGGASGTLLNGKFESFYSNKQLLKKGNFKKGLKNGEWMEWRGDGSLLLVEKWRNGELRSFIFYNKNGKEIKRITYQRNTFQFETKDSIVESKNNGVKEKIIIKNENGEIVRIERRKSNKLNGVQQTFENGELIKSEKYKNGILIEKEKSDKKSQENESTDIKKDRKFFNFKKLNVFKTKKDKNQPGQDE